MTRLSQIELEIPDRLPEEGLHRLHKAPQGRWTKETAKLANRQWELVDPRLRELFAELAAAKKRWPLYLWGGVGTGKTWAVKLFSERVELGRCYWTVDQLMDLVGSETGGPWHWILGFGFSLVVLDELGLPRCSQAAQNYDYDCVKRFLDWRGSRPAIYVSNHPLEAIDKLYDARIRSRLGVGTVYELTGHDRRRRP